VKSRDRAAISNATSASAVVAPEGNRSASPVGEVEVSVFDFMPPAAVLPWQRTAAVRGARFDEQKKKKKSRPDETLRHGAMRNLPIQKDIAARVHRLDTDPGERRKRCEEKKAKCHIDV
jgi:hypothetical protein